MQTTIGKLADIILDRYYGGIPSDDSSITSRHVGELIAIEIAYAAKKSAFENSNAGEATYANDQFISVWNNLTLQTDAVTKEKYIPLPATPVGLPNNQEITSVAFSACPNTKVIPLKQKDTFAQGFLMSPKGIVNYKIENGNIYFINIGALVTGAISVKMVGSVSGTTLLGSVLNVPKDYENDIIDRVLTKLGYNPNRIRDTINFFR